MTNDSQAYGAGVYGFTCRAPACPAGGTAAGQDAPRRAYAAAHAHTERSGHQTTVYRALSLLSRVRRVPVGRSARR